MTDFGLDLFFSTTISYFIIFRRHARYQIIMFNQADRIIYPRELVFKYNNNNMGNTCVDRNSTLI
jgi:hypothetical protein